MRWRAVVWAIRVAIAAALTAAGVWLWLGAWRLSLELGAALFAPMMLGAGVLCFFLAVGAVAPWLLRNDGPGFWASMVRLFRF